MVNIKNLFNETKRVEISLVPYFAMFTDKNTKIDNIYNKGKSAGEESKGVTGYIVLNGFISAAKTFVLGVLTNYLNNNKDLIK